MEFYEIKKEIYEILMNSEYFTIYLGKPDAYKLDNNEKIYIKKNNLIVLKELLNSSDEEYKPSEKSQRKNSYSKIANKSQLENDINNI